MSLSPEQAQATSRRVTVLDGSFLFFAYGSDMLTERLRERCPEARPLGAAIARGARIRDRFLDPADALIELGKKYRAQSISGLKVVACKSGCFKGTDIRAARICLGG